jgi:type II secretory pathway component PulK
MTARRGFALLAVLWVVVAIAALAAGAVEHARADATVTGGSVARMRARWAAEGCLAVTQARMDATLSAGQPFSASFRDTLHFADGAACRAEDLDPTARILRDSTSAAISRRLDSALIASGLDTAQSDTFFTRYGDGRINLNAAPAAVIGLLPGIGPEALRVIATARSWNRPINDLPDLAARLSAAARPCSGITTES